MVHVFEIEKGKRFVAGLFWQPLSSSSRGEIASIFKGAGKETCKLAEDLHMDLAVWRVAGIPHVGLGATGEGAKPGFYSAAAVISKSVEMEHGSVRDFICATEIGDGRWLYVVQREGVIIPHGDTVGTEDEIRARLMSDTSVSSWNLVFAPEYWGIDKSIERTFEQFLPRNRHGKIQYHGWWQLRPIKAQLARPLLGAVVAVSVMVGAYTAYSKWQEHKAFEEAARLAALQAAQGETNAPPPPPWEGLPRAHVFWNGCFDGMRAVSSFWPGNWAPQEATCANGAFTISWRRGEHGWIDHLRTMVPEAVLSIDGTTATYSVPIEAPAEGEAEALPAERERVLEMHGAGQRYGFEVVLSAPAAPPVLPGQQQGPAPAPTWREVMWAVNGSALPPSVVLAALNGDGFRVARVSAQFDNGLMTWTMEGSQYVQP